MAEELLPALLLAQGVVDAFGLEAVFVFTGVRAFVVTLAVEFAAASDPAGLELSGAEPPSALDPPVGPVLAPLPCELSGGELVAAPLGDPLPLGDGESVGGGLVDVDGDGLELSLGGGSIEAVGCEDALGDLDGQPGELAEPPGWLAPPDCTPVPLSELTPPLPPVPLPPFDPPLWVSGRFDPALEPAWTE